MGASGEAAEITTLLAPALMCAEAMSIVVKMPEDSTTMVTPRSPQGMVEGSRLQGVMLWTSKETLHKAGILLVIRSLYSIAQTMLRQGTEL